MSIWQIVYLGLVWGGIFGTVFCAAILLLGKINPEMIINDYPPDVRARVGPMGEKTRRQASIASLLLLIALGIVIAGALIQFRAGTGQLTFWNTLIFTTVIFQVWNLIDLIVLDWFLLMTLKPGFMIFPGTEGMAGYKNYGFHFRKFLNGIGLTFIVSGIISAIALLMETLAG